MNYIGDFAEDSTVRIALTTNDGSGGAVAPSSAFEVADFRVYKNGSATQKTSDNGMTITSPFDSVVGLHILEIDTSNDTGDSGFWTTAADYWVVAIPDETVDSQTVVQVVATFSIENRYMRGTDGANTTTPPTAAANATAVRSELTTELGRIDVATSTRLAGASYSAAPSAATVADAVWDEATVDHTSTGSFGYVIGLLFGLLENVTGWRFTTKALEQAPSGSGDSVIVGPLVQTNSQRSQPSYIETYQYDQSSLGPFRIEDANGDQYDLAGITDWIVIVWDKDNNELGVVPYADLDITSSTSNAVMDQYSFAPVAGQVATDGRHRFALRRPRGTSEQTAASGTFNVIATPRGPEA